MVKQGVPEDDSDAATGSSSAMRSRLSYLEAVEQRRHVKMP